MPVSVASPALEGNAPPYSPSFAAKISQNLRPRLLVSLEGSKSRFEILLFVVFFFT
jgi:hypothetical protein